MNNLLYGKKIVKSFGTGAEKHNVLNGINVEINCGEFISIMGQSGSGKSTLLYALSGMDTIDSGEVNFENQELSTLSDDELSDIRRNRMGFIFQQPTLLKNLDILDNIILPQMKDKHRDLKKLIDKARILMKQMGIDGLEHRDITQVSGGQLQRAGICRALMSEPKIIFGDEPTGALNTKSAKEIMEILTQINNNGTTIVIVTHDSNIAARTERVLFLCDGEIVSEYRMSKFIEKNMNKRVYEIMQKMHDIGI